jgi:hypothetical protein
VNSVDDRPVEERLRAAVHAYVPDDSAPPLRLRPQPAPAARRQWRRARGWTIPLAAAAAVIAVIAASLLIPRIGGSSSANDPAAAAAQALGVPPYYVATWVTQPNTHAHVEVRATTTGALEATVNLPAPYDDNAGVLATAANDHVFLLDGLNHLGHQHAFLLRFTPGSNATQLTPLSIPVSPTTSVPFALSPDGTQLAWVNFRTGDINKSLTIDNLATSTERTWNGFAPSISSWFGSLAWSAGGRSLQFSWWNNANEQVFFGHLDPSAPGGSLPAPTASITAPALNGGELLTDGHLSIVVTTKSRTQVEIFSPHGGAPVVIPIWGAGGPPVKELPNPAWYSDSGDTMILEGVAVDLAVGVLNDGHYHPLSLPRALKQLGGFPTSPYLTW